MVNFKEKLTVEKGQIAYNISKRMTKKSKILWAIIYGVLLLVFLVAAILLKVLEGPLIYIVLAALIILVVYLNFFHDAVKFKLSQKKLSKLIDESNEEVIASIDFNAEHLAIDTPVRAKKGIIRIDYDKISKVYFDDQNKALFFLLKGDNGDYYTLFLDGQDKLLVKEACETFPNDIINQDQLEAYLGLKIERVFVEEYNPEEDPYKDEKSNEPAVLEEEQSKEEDVVVEELDGNDDNSLELEDTDVEKSADEEAKQLEEQKEVVKEVKDIYHVSQNKDPKSPHHKEWRVRKEGSTKTIKYFNTQKEAIEFANGLAKNTDGSVRVHRLDGKIRQQ